MAAGDMPRVQALRVCGVAREQAECLRGTVKGSRMLQAGNRAVPRPRPCLGASRELGFHRVACEVAEQLQEVRVVGDGDALEAVAHEMTGTGAIAYCIAPAGIASVEFPHAG